MRAAALGFRELGLPHGRCRYDSTHSQSQDQPGDDELRKLKGRAHQDDTNGIDKGCGKYSPSTTPYNTEERAG